MALVKNWIFGVVWWAVALFAIVLGSFFVLVSAVLRKLEGWLDQKATHVKAADSR